jgi:hypothetical protein
LTAGLWGVGTPAPGPTYCQPAVSYSPRYCGPTISRFKRVQPARCCAGDQGISTPVFSCAPLHEAHTAARGAADSVRPHADAGVRPTLQWRTIHCITCRMVMLVLCFCNVLRTTAVTLCREHAPGGSTMRQAPSTGAVANPDAAAGAGGPAAGSEPAGGVASIIAGAPPGKWCSRWCCELFATSWQLVRETTAWFARPHLLKMRCCA